MIIRKPIEPQRREGTEGCTKVREDRIVDESDLIFEINDYEGTPVVLSQATWHSKAGNGEGGDHPEIRGYLEETAEAIRDPDFVLRIYCEAEGRLGVLNLEF